MAGRVIVGATFCGVRARTAARACSLVSAVNVHCHLQELLPGFRAVWESYFAQVKALGVRVLRLIAIALELPPEYFAPWFDG